jgi:hypothetical protein
MLAKAPHCLLAPLFRILLAQDRKHHPSGDLPLEAIIPTMRHDVQLAKDTEGVIQSFGAIDADVLLMGGGKSLPYLRLAVDELEAVLPDARRVAFRGLNQRAGQQRAPYGCRRSIARVRRMRRASHGLLRRCLDIGPQPQIAPGPAPSLL